MTAKLTHDPLKCCEIYSQPGVCRYHNNIETLLLCCNVARKCATEKVAKARRQNYLMLLIEEDVGTGLAGQGLLSQLLTLAVYVDRHGSVVSKKPGQGGKMQATNKTSETNSFSFRDSGASWPEYPVGRRGPSTQCVTNTNKHFESKETCNKRKDEVGSCFFFAETFRSFFAKIFWSLRHFGHLSHSCIKTHGNSVF